MAATTYADFIIPEIWQPYMEAKIPEVSKLFSSRAVYRDPNPAFSGKGVYEYIPFIKEFTTDMVIPTAETDLTIQKLATDKDILVCLHRAIAVGEEKNAARRAGEELVDSFLATQTEYLAKQIEKRGYYLLKGIFASGGALATTHQHPVNATIDATAIFAAKYKLGDNADNLQTMVMHSKVYADLLNAGLVTFVNAADMGKNIAIQAQIPTFAGMEIIVTDLVNKTTDASPVYSTYLLGNGSIYYAQPYFSIDKFDDVLLAGGTKGAVYNLDFCWHVPGVKFNLSSKTNVTDAELYAAATWAKVADHDKDIKIVELTTL